MGGKTTCCSDQHVLRFSHRSIPAVIKRYLVALEGVVERALSAYQCGAYFAYGF